MSSCDALVVPVGHSSMCRAINVVQKLWSSGVSADITYDFSQVSMFFKNFQVVSSAFSVLDLS